MTRTGSVSVFEAYIIYHELELVTSHDDDIYFCHARCAQCEVSSFCTDIAGISIPILSKDEFEQIKQDHPEYFI